MALRKNKLLSRSTNIVTPPPKRNFGALLRDLRDLIAEGRTQAVRAVNTVQVQTCWGIGRYIVDFEQNGSNRAAYGAKLLSRLADRLTAEFGKGFDERNLRNMRAFHLTFPIRNAVRSELSWTHYRTLIRIDDSAARAWYMNEAITQNWSSRALERQINRLYYERLLSSKDQQIVRKEAAQKITELQPSPRDFVRDPIMLEFLGLTETKNLLESTLEQKLIDHLHSFLLELGKGFAFVGRQVRVSTESKDFYIDLVFYNYILKCFVIFDLKPRELTHEDIGQMDMYVRMYDDLNRTKGDNPTVGIILCAAKDASMVKYSILKDNKRLFASHYRLILPSEETLRREIIREQKLLEDQIEQSKPTKPNHLSSSRSKVKPAKVLSKAKPTKRQAR